MIVKAKRLYKDLRKASFALPLIVTILLAVAIAGVAVFHIANYRMPGETTAEEVTAFDFKERYDHALQNARQMKRDSETSVIARFIGTARLFDIEFDRLARSPHHDLLLSKGLEREYTIAGDLAQQIDAYIAGDPTLSPDILATSIEQAHSAVTVIARAINDNSDEATAALRAQLNREAMLIFVLVSLFILSLAVLVPVEWTRRNSLMAKTRALQISEGKLRDLSFYRQQFLANMSHEFRTPLNAIQGFSEAILIQKDTMKQERIFEYVDIVARSARDLATLTEDVIVTGWA